MSSVEEEEQEVSMRPLKLHRGQLASDSVGGQVFVWDLQILFRIIRQSELAVNWHLWADVEKTCDWRRRKLGKPLWRRQCLWRARRWPFVPY